MSHSVFISAKSLAKRYGVSEKTIWRWCQRDQIPSPIRISSGCTRWNLGDIELWESKFGSGSLSSNDTGAPAALGEHG